MRKLRDVTTRIKETTDTKLTERFASILQIVNLCDLDFILSCSLHILLVYRFARIRALIEIEKPSIYLIKTAHNVQYILAYRPQIITYFANRRGENSRHEWNNKRATFSELKRRIDDCALMNLSLSIEICPTRSLLRGTSTRNGSNMFLMEPHRRLRWIMKHEFNLRRLEIHLNLKWTGSDLIGDKMERPDS